MLAKMLQTTTENGTHGIELYFDGKPAAEVLETLKSALFRWHRVKKCWYHRDTPDARRIAESMANGTDAGSADESEKSAANVRKTAKKALPSLWERCDLSTIPAHDKNLSNKEIAAQVRAHLRERFPEVKFSLRCHDSGYTGSIDGEILSAPYGREYVQGDPSAVEYWKRWEHWENSPELEAVLKYFDAFLQSYNYDNSDYMTDYFDVGFYGRFEIAGSYEQTTPTAEQAEQIEKFRADKAEAERRAEEERRAQFERQEREREAAAKAEEIRRAQEEKDAAAIAEHVEIVDLPEAEQVAAMNLAEGIGKENSLKELQDRINEKNAEAIQKKLDPADDWRDAIISRKIIFKDAELFGKFCGMFLRDWDFLNGKGGSASEDVRLNSWEEFLQLTKEQRKQVHTFSVDCVGVYIYDVLRLVIDPQGYKYARYVMLPTQATTTANAAEYREGWREISRKASPFHIPAPLSEQLKNANLQPGETFSALYMDGFIMSVIPICGRIVSAMPCEYAQYKDAARIVYIPNGKQKPREIVLHAGQDAAIWRGALPEVPDNIKYTPAGSPNMRLVNYSGDGCGDFLRRAIGYYEQLGRVPVVDLVAR